MAALIPIQLSLGVSLRDDATFANFYIGQDNALAIHALKQFSQAQGEQNLVIWGPVGAGLSHLLQACCHAVFDSAGATQPRGIQYLPLPELLEYDPQAVCDGLESLPLVCLDGLEAICGNPAWELALFHLLNRLRDQGQRLLIASHVAPAALPLQLADLKSRILGSVIYHLHPLDDEEKGKALQLRANARGMEMPAEVSRFILHRAGRDTSALFSLLDTLDRASLQQQRKLTIPFVKAVLASPLS
jgi:DnaA family protein